MAIGKDTRTLEQSIGYTFADPSLAAKAMTHTSYANEMRDLGHRFESNQRLEFLGDAVVEILVSEELYVRFPDADEGLLTNMRKHLVCRETMAKIAEKLGLGAFLHLGNGEEESGGRTREKVLCDALEALIAAVYLDCGKNDRVWKPVVCAFFESEFSGAKSAGRGDYKSRLQQFAEQDGSAELRYETETAGPSHNPVYTARAYLNSNLVGTGVSSTIKDAEMLAAKAALALFGMET